MRFWNEQKVMEDGVSSLNEKIKYWKDKNRLRMFLSKTLLFVLT